MIRDNSRQEIAGKMGRICGYVGVPPARIPPEGVSGFLDRCHRSAAGSREPDSVLTGNGFGLGVRGADTCQSSDGRYTCMLDSGLASAPVLVDGLTASGFIVQGRSPAEVFLDAFVRHGVLSFKHLKGGFACAIFDHQKECLILAVDASGLKHLYYADMPTGLVFASDLTGLARFGLVPLSIGEAGALEYFSLGFISPPLTIYEGISSLRVGGYLVWDSGNATCEIYHKVIGDRFEFCDVQGLSEADLVDRLDELLIKAVISRLPQGDGPVATYLSGGLDTGMMAACLRRHSDRPVTAYTLGSHHSRHDEVPRARKVARHLGLQDHRCVYMTEDDCFAAMDELPDVFGQPMADISAIPNLVITKVVGRDFAEVLAGDGPDGLYGNWDLRPWHYYYQVVPALLRHPVACMVDALDRWFKLGLSTPSRQVYELLDQKGFSWVYHKKFKGTDLEKLLGRKVDGMEFEVGRYLRDRTDIPLYERLRMGFAKYFVMHGVLLKSGTIHDAQQVTQVCPYYDRNLVDFICTLPTRFKTRGSGYGKYLHRQLLLRYAPAQVWQGRKQGFIFDFADFDVRRLRGLIDHYLAPARVGESGLLNVDFATEIRDEFLGGLKRRGPLVMTLLNFEMWREKFLG